MEAQPLVIILGPTASGKTKLAVKLAAAVGGEIISADSRQVFRGMDIGTGKDLEEYNAPSGLIPYHLIDIKQAGDHYNVNEFKEDFYEVFATLVKQQQLPILCGGTGMYIHALLQHQPYTAVPVNQALRNDLMILDDEQLLDKLAFYPVAFTGHADRTSKKRLIRAIEVADYLMSNQLPEVSRIPIRALIIGLDPGRELRRKNVSERLNIRLENGLIEEVERLLKNGVSDEMLTFYGLEYKFVASYIRMEITMDQLKERLTIAICQFAKRQMTFFRKMEKDGVEINWFDTNANDKLLFDNVLSLYLSYRKTFKN
ncbi:tRNA (adenosine(37)-N6)-dimethylallyltransferase MiaA [Pedobacter sp. PWIIR3]